MRCLCLFAAAADAAENLGLFSGVLAKLPVEGFWNLKLSCQLWPPPPSPLNTEIPNTVGVIQGTFIQVYGKTSEPPTRYRYGGGEVKYPGEVTFAAKRRKKWGIDGFCDGIPVWMMVGVSQDLGGVSYPVGDQRGWAPTPKRVVRRFGNFFPITEMF